MVMIESFRGDLKEIDCVGCALMSGEVDSSNYNVLETEHFEVGQDYETPIEGFMIIGSKKHVKGIEAFSEGERNELMKLLFRTRKAMRKALEIETVYIIQEEDSSHFHIWLFPRLSWMDDFGEGIESVRNIVDYARESLKTEKQVDKVDDAIQLLSAELN